MPTRFQLKSNASFNFPPSVDQARVNLAEGEGGEAPLSVPTVWRRQKAEEDSGYPSLKAKGKRGSQTRAITVVGEKVASVGR